MRVNAEKITKDILDELSRKKLLVVTGKGGTGKSALSVALAFYFAKKGKKVWLVEFGRKHDSNFSRLHELLDSAPLHHKITKIMEEKNGALWASRIDPTESLAEYVGLKIPGGNLASLLLKNRVTASFLEIVPGLLELVCLGKLWFHLTNKKANPAPDLIILDGPASGHAVTLLHAPSNFSRLTKQGPIYSDAEKMQKFLHNPENTSILFTSLPEEMSLEETREHRELLKEFSQPLLFINKNFPRIKNIKIPANTPEILTDSYHYSQQRAERENSAIKNFQKETHNWPIVNIPFFFPDSDKIPLAKKILESFL